MDAMMRIGYQTEVFKVVEAASDNLSDDDMEMFIYRVSEMLKDFTPKGGR